MESTLFSNFIVSVNAVLPMLCLMLLGVLIKKCKWMNDLELRHANGVVFRIFFFFMLFNATYRAKVDDYRPILILYAVGSVLILFVLTWYFSGLVTDNLQSRSAMTQALYRSNFVIMGLPVVINIYGMENCGITAMLVAAVVPMYNVLAVLMFESCRNGKISFLEMMKNILSNPMVVGFLVGGVIRLADIQLPLFAERLSHQLAMMTSPLALIILGASFAGMGKPNFHQVWICVLGRLVVIPCLFLSAAYYFGYREIEFVSLLVMYAAPTAVISYAMAQQMGSDDVLAGNSVVYSTVLSCFTLFCWIFIWKTIGAF